MQKRALAGLLAGLTLSACGSTVQMLGAPGAGTGLSLQPGMDGTAAAGGAGAAGVSVPSTGTTATGPRTVSAGPAVTAQTVPRGAAPAVAGSRSAVEVGIVYFPDVSAFASALGGSASVGDQRAEAQAAVDWVNAHGGLAGHRIVPVYFAVQLTSTQPYDETEQEICDSFTQDHHVVAALMVGANVDNVMPQCFTSKRVLYLTGGHYLHDGTDYASFPYMVSPSEAGASRVAKALVDLILDRRLAKSGDTLGLLVIDEPAADRAVDDVVIPALKAHGISVAEYKVPYPASTPDTGNSVSLIDSAELKMYAQGVKTVMSLCPGCIAFFQKNAESQHYYPRYVLSSYDDPLALSTSANARQMANAVGIGFEPVKDVGTFTHPDVVRGNPTYDLCRTIEKSSGQVRDNQSNWAAQLFCDAVLQLYAAARAHPPRAVTGDTLLAGLTGLGTSHPSAMSFATSLSPRKHDGADAFRTLHFDAACTCVVYDDHTDHPLP
jgi:hypothetical protein